MEFTDQQIQRYSRHLILNEVGGKGQAKLSHAKVLIIGAGGLGSPAGLYLAAAGIGTIGLVDGDVVDLSNLQRQILHSTATVGKPKVESGQQTLTAVNPDITVKTYQYHVDASNILGLIQDYDIILDGSDNFTTRFLVNDACFFGNVFGNSGRLVFRNLFTTLWTKERVLADRNTAGRATAGNFWR